MFINHAYFMLFEQPELEKSFKRQYRPYEASVPRWIPRMKL
jgi:protein-S-isoprenylcysteine O-methyltransferase Ste14